MANETRVVGFALVVEFTDPAIGPAFNAAQGKIDAKREVFLLSVQYHQEPEKWKARLCFENATPETVSLPVSDIDDLLAKCHITAVEKRLVDATWSIPPMRRDGDLIGLCNLLPPNCVMAEIGSFAGESAVQFRQSGKVALLICVDNWLGGYSPGDEASMANMARVKEAFDYRMSDPKLLGECRAIQSDSVAAAALIKDESLDMAYIDADHGYLGVRADLEAWIPKVKRGGLIAGHDWHLAHFGVVKAVIDVIGKPDGITADSSWWKRKS